MPEQILWRPGCDISIAMICLDPDILGDTMNIITPPDSYMRRILALQILFLVVAFVAAAQPVAPTNVVVFSGDQSAIMHWDLYPGPNLAGYNV